MGDNPEKRFVKHLKSLKEHSQDYINGKKKGFLGSKEFSEKDYEHTFKEINNSMNNLFAMWRLKLPDTILANKSYVDFMGHLPTIRNVLNNSSNDVQKVKGFLSKLVNEIPL